MNADQAKAIAITTVFDKLNLKPAWDTETEAMYLSPLREEKTASFHVHKIKNCWFDFGSSIGGNTIDFVCKYLATQGVDNTVSDALRWLKNMTVNDLHISKLDVSDFTTEDKKLSLISVSDLKHLALLRYTESRGINRAIAQNYFKQVRVHNKSTNQYFVSLGLKNEDSGYELRNPFFKGSVGTKGITFIRGHLSKPKAIHIFEGIMDFLSILAIKQKMSIDDDVIILNSLVFLKSAIAYTKGYGYENAYTWLDNDAAGDKATKLLSEFFKTQESLNHKPMNMVYLPHKDGNAWHMHNHNLSL